MRGRRNNIYDEWYGYNDFYDRRYVNPYDEDFKREKRKGHHFHEFEGNTSPTKEHEHEYLEKTIKTVGTGDKHIHYFKFETNVENGHTHKIIGKTGPAIETEDGGHTHIYDGITSIDNGHMHFYQGYTSPEMYKRR